MMGKEIIVKIKFENSDKIIEMILTETETPFQDQQKAFLENTDHENLEYRMMCHLYNPKANMFLSNISDIKEGN